jgi:hypothetical protein
MIDSALKVAPRKEQESGQRGGCLVRVDVLDVLNVPKKASRFSRLQS